MTFTLKEVYATLDRWQQELKDAGKWVPRDDDIKLGIIILTAPTKEGPGSFRVLLRGEVEPLA